jgi:ATP-dependent Clp endopeptidase proteolytic subunit ClpP
MKIEIENRAGVIKLNSGVNKESADKLIDDLDRLYGQSAVLAQMCIGEVVCSANDALERVEVEINSPGGSVFEGQRIYNALRAMSARGVNVTTKVNGLAASMGSVILMAGDQREMTAGSRVMIHEASTIAMGDARALRTQSDLLESISAEIAGIYAERTGQDEKEMRKLMYAETWMTADEAMQNGFVDTVIKDGKDKSKFDTAAKGMTGLLSKLFPGNDEAAKIEASLTENDTLRAELSTANATIAELLAVGEANLSLQAELVTARQDLVSLQSKFEESLKAVTELEDDAANIDQHIAEKASELLASTGHPSPVALAEVAIEISIRAQYAAITNPAERSAFRKANWEKLSTNN